MVVFLDVGFPLSHSLFGPVMVFLDADFPIPLSLFIPVDVFLEAARGPSSSYLSCSGNLGRRHPSSSLSLAVPSWGGILRQRYPFSFLSFMACGGNLKRWFP